MRGFMYEQGLGFAACLFGWWDPDVGLKGDRVCCLVDGNNLSDTKVDRQQQLLVGMGGGS